MSLPAVLDRVLRDPLHAARSGRAIGYLGWDVPVELILAAGAVPVQLSALASAGDTALADRYLENSFSAQSRTVAQRWLSGDLDALEAVIFSRSDDSAQRLYYYLCELQRFGECKGPRPLLFDLARIGRATSVAHTVESTRSLAAAIGADAARLNAAVQRVSARLSLLDGLAKLRGSDSAPPGRLAYRIARAARADWSEEFDRSLRAWLATPMTTEPRKRVLLVGSVPPDDQPHAAIETNDVIVVGEINEAGVGHSGVPSKSVGIEAVAHRCYQQTTAASTLLQSPTEIVKRARALRADGVIVWMLATDTGLAWEAPRIELACRAAQLPTLMLTSQPQCLSTDALAQLAQFRTTLEVA
ncbi:MAG TPA: 2-hydroxyacyl-CoA dehydratase family protein [Steroidobacter sp.]|uniref:2-hydroxyacyl-CoA dehydratase family protein n=1 Tax=Steroidobacter sp. TaxID=1978227 RepID=UPI002ED7F9BA